MINGGSWLLMVINGGAQWFVAVAGDSWCLTAVAGGWCGRWWFMVAHASKTIGWTNLISKRNQQLIGFESRAICRDTGRIIISFKRDLSVYHHLVVSLVVSYHSQRMVNEPPLVDDRIPNVTSTVDLLNRNMTMVTSKMHSACWRHVFFVSAFLLTKKKRLATQEQER